MAMMRAVMADRPIPYQLTDLLWRAYDRIEVWAPTREHALRSMHAHGFTRVKLDDLVQCTAS